MTQHDMRVISDESGKFKSVFDGISRVFRFKSVLIVFIWAMIGSWYNVTLGPYRDSGQYVTKKTFAFMGIMVLCYLMVKYAYRVMREGIQFGLSIYAKAYIRFIIVSAIALFIVPFIAKMTV